MAWIWLIIGGFFEVGFTTCLRYVDGFRNIPWTLGFQLIYIPVLFVAGFFGPVLLMWAVRNSPARRFYRLLFG